jgi:hypothetical protein
VIEQATKPRQRALRSDAGVKRGAGKIAIELTLQPDNIAWARAQIKQLGYRSISEYVDHLIAQQEIASRIL